MATVDTLPAEIMEELSEIYIASQTVPLAKTWLGDIMREAYKRNYSTHSIAKSLSDLCGDEDSKFAKMACLACWQERGWNGKTKL
jgi:hypothetical protein